MPLKIELQGQGAGSAVLQVSGDIDTPESVALAIQRNDGLYLGPSDPTHPDQVWQTSPHWRPQFGVQPRPGGLAMRLGADIVDGVIDAGGVPLKVSLRLDEQEESGVLRIRGELIGSGAAAPPPIPDTARDTDIPLEPEPGMPDVILEPEPQDRSDPTPAMIPEPPEHWKPQPAKKRRWWPWLLLLVLLGATAGAWYLGLFTPQPETADTGEQPNAVTPSSEQAAATTDEKPAQPAQPGQQQPGDADEQAASPATSGDPGDAHQDPAAAPKPAALTGVAFARQFLADHPAPEAIFNQAGKAEQSGDCDAALVLFNTAANQDPAQATRLAARYDPRDFEPGPCIDQADAPYAIIFYGDAAATGAITAQRRLGQLLTARETSGPTFEEGLEWLRKAAAAGDSEARASLEQLEKRP